MNVRNRLGGTYINEGELPPAPPAIIHRPGIDALYETVVFIPDLHCPYHDTVVWAQVLRFIRAFQPDRIVFLGDLIDAYPLSRFSKDPARKGCIQGEFDSGSLRLAEAREAAPNAEIDYCPGNHEKRFDLFLWEKAPALASLRCMALGEQLHVADHGVTLHPYAGFKLRPKYRCTHGTLVRKHSGHSAKGEYDKWGISGASAHTHRAGTYTVSNEAGTASWTEFGHLCHVESAEYVQSPNWQQAIGVGWFHRASSRYQVELVQIAGRELVYQGTNYANLSKLY